MVRVVRELGTARLRPGGIFYHAEARCNHGVLTYCFRVARFVFANLIPKEVVNGIKG
jgi:hypothetical protein